MNECGFNCTTSSTQQQQTKQQLMELCQVIVSAAATLPRVNTKKHTKHYRNQYKL